MADGTRQQVDDVSALSVECSMCQWLGHRSMLIEAKLLAVKYELELYSQAIAEHERLIHEDDLPTVRQEEDSLQEELPF